MKKDYDAELAKLRVNLNTVSKPRLIKPIRENFPNNKSWGEAMDIEEARFAECQNKYNEFSKNIAMQRNVLDNEFWVDLCEEFRWNLLPQKIRVYLVTMIKSQEIDTYSSMYDDASELSELSDAILEAIRKK